ncbi:hypothetical protein NTJ56_31260 [Burkholderia contaminans]|uniref:hypothetical protein n=1 Tax=Burkholderia contaminans TaxID=488447 RepID=UPI001CF4DD8E|nr:hypothetical protein [Burkholderia contaminans]MCA7916473.1 hypothetical protein [Burkholderia contaminans]MCA8095799.1 hypothetical protein [Burkholderia contaminans]UUX40153.1 hypothetical protein NTJ56_31260 [Burkholderia contaminans]
MAIINSDFEMGYLVIASTLLGLVLFGALLTALHLRWHPRLVGAALGALLGIALIEAIPMLT